MKKLENYLKHYLNTGLQCSLMGEIKDENSDVSEPKLFTLNGITTEAVSKTTFFSCDDDEHNHEVCESEIFPVLHPLSDLTKEIEINGEKFIPEIEISKASDLIGYKLHVGYYNPKENRFTATLKDIDNRKSRTIALDLFEYMKIFEWHFDVFGLIPAGLAIDINTIKK